MKRPLYFLLLILSFDRSFAQGTFKESPYYLRRQDSTFKHFDITRKKISGFQLGITTGAFVPTGGLSVVGQHIAIGGIVGWRFNRVLVDMNITGRLGGNAAKTYQVAFNDTPYQTNGFRGGFYFGLDLGYVISQRGKHEWDILGGAAAEGFGCVVNDGRDTVNFNAMNVNAGIGYKLFLRHLPPATFVRHAFRRVTHRPYSYDVHLAERLSYLAIQVKYNFLNFSNPGGTDLSGNAVTVGVTYGMYRNPRSENIFKRDWK